MDQKTKSVTRKSEQAKLASNIMDINSSNSAPPIYNRSQVRDRSSSKSTWVSYRSNLNVISKWIHASQESPDHFSDDDGTINLHVFTATHFEEYLLYRLNNQGKKTKAGTLNGYRSTIKGLCRRKKMTVSDEYIGEMKLFYSGLKLIDAN